MELNKKILKGILLWTTVFMAVFLVSCISSIIDKGLEWLFLPYAFLNWVIYKTISEEEFKELSLYNKFVKYIGADD